MCLIAFGLVVMAYVLGTMWGAVTAVGTWLRGLL